MQAATSKNLQLIYEGSVKRVFAAPGQSDRLWFEFSDDYSVFDWGKMPDTIANKGRALTVMGAHFFQALAGAELWQRLPSSPVLGQIDKQWLQAAFARPIYKRLCQRGLPHHFHRLCDGKGTALSTQAAATEGGAVFMEVDKAEVARPQAISVLGQIVYKYPQAAASQVRLIPLEVVFRFGMPAGSSLQQRLENHPEYARQLGLQRMPGSNEWFDRPLLEFFTKLEPKDRLLSLCEALNISTISGEQFAELVDLATLISLALRHLFGCRAIELWDGKLEFIFRNGEVCLADSIGPDELRLIYEGIQLSKETIRQVYRGTSWEKNLKRAQALAAERGNPQWKAICRDELKSQPALLPAQFKQNIDHLYGVLANHITQKSLFPAQPTLAAFAKTFSAEKHS